MYKWLARILDESFFPGRRTPARHARGARAVQCLG